MPRSCISATPLSIEFHAMADDRVLVSVALLVAAPLETRAVGVEAVERRVDGYDEHLVLPLALVKSSAELRHERNEA